MHKLYIDFETRSALPISVGTERYLAATSDIVCMSYSLDQSTTCIWIPGQPLPPELNVLKDPNSKFYAFNASFDFRVWNKHGVKYGFPPIEWHQVVDIMALCGRYGFPQSLDKACKVLRVKQPKLKIGKKLMKKICTKPYQYTVGEFQQFLSYCIRDTTAMTQVLNQLPADHLSPEENEIWQLSNEINQRGVPIDIELVKIINRTIEQYLKWQVARLGPLTNDQIYSVNQHVAIRKWLETKGVYTPSLDKDHVAKLLERDNLDDDVRDVLEIRKDCGRSSVAKYRALLWMTYNGIIYDNHRYYGARTGRWAGLGFQLHNLPRASVEDIEAEIEKFCKGLTTKGGSSPMYAASALIRSMIKAPTGEKLAIADYASIENVLLAFVAGEEHVLQLFRNGKDEYTDFATRLYGVPYDKVTSKQRKNSKPGILGGGYGLAWKTFMSYAAGFGVVVTEPEAKQTIKLYRDGHPNVVRMWGAGAKAAMDAVGNKNLSFPFYGNSFRTVTDRVGRLWLVLQLMSGRQIFYPEPKIIEGRFGKPVPSYMAFIGIDGGARKWQRVDLPAHKITENLIQALARDLLAFGCVTLRTRGYKIIGTVHDEVIIRVDNGMNSIEPITDAMCVLPPWAKGLPLTAEGEFSQRYRKI